MAENQDREQISKQVRREKKNANALLTEEQGKNYIRLFLRHQASKMKGKWNIWTVEIILYPVKSSLKSERNGLSQANKVSSGKCCEKKESRVKA